MSHVQLNSPKISFKVEIDTVTDMFIVIKLGNNKFQRTDKLYFPLLVKIRVRELWCLMALSEHP